MSPAAAPVQRALNKAAAHLKNGDVLGAQRAFYRARDLSGRDPEVLREIGHRWRTAGWNAAIARRDPETGSALFHNARDIYRSLGGDPHLWEVVRGLAITAAMLEEHDTAFRLCDEAEALAPDAVARAKVWNTRGVSNSYLGRFAEARRWAEKALAATNVREVAETARQTIGIAWMHEGRPKEALPLLKDPVNVAWAQLEAGNPRAVLAIAPGKRPRAFTYRARAWLALGKRAEALAELRRGARVIEAGRAERDTDDARAAFSGAAHGVHELLVQLEAEAGRWEAAFRAAESGRARAFLDFAAAPRPRDLSHLRRSEQRRFEANRADIEKEHREGHDGEKLRKLEDAERLAMRRYEKERLARKRVPTRKPLGAAQVRRALAAGEALVQFQVDNDAILAFVLTRDRFRPLRLPFPAPPVLAAAQDLPRALDLARREERRGDQGFADWHFGFLGEALLAPLPLDGVSRLVVVPHGALHLVPFAALRVRGRPAAELFAVASAPSSSAYATLKSRPRAFDARRARCLFVNDPTGSLPYAAGEEAALRRAFGRRLTVLGERDASRAAVLRLAPRHEVLHFATHAVWRPDRAELSYLELARRERLTASDLLALDLSRTRAAVLSACDSGRGDYARAEEMFGLPRAFLRAGAASVLATLWPLEDHGAIGDFMETYYSGGLSAGGAQRRAIRDGMPRSLWGAWVQLGI
ncbi:MAG: CHAT domain-containing protein [Planctomycetes bacterium]|nr:CHAT domain-containing protein [Planctomycetota bacterium]